MKIKIAALILGLVITGLGITVYTFSDHYWYRDFKATVSINGQPVESPRVFRHSNGDIFVEGAYKIVPGKGVMTSGEGFDLWLVVVAKDPQMGGVWLNDGVKFETPRSVKISENKAEFTGLFYQKFIVTWE